MKTKSLVLALAGALLLTACAETPTESQPVNSADPAVSSSEVPAPSSSVSLTDAEISDKALNDLVANLGQKKQKMELAIGNKDYGSMIFAEKGFVQEYENELSGAVLNSQAWFAFTIANNQLSLGNVISLDKTEAPYYYGVDIAALGKDIYTVDANNPRRFTSTDATLLGIGAAIAGSSTAASAVTLVVNDDSIVFGFTIASQKVYYTFSEFGTASNAVLDAFIASPTNKVAPTGFSAKEFANLTDLMGNEASKVPFPSWATFAFATEYDEEDQVFRMVELQPTANALETYAAQLVGKGWTKEADVSEDNDQYFTLAIPNDEEHFFVINAYTQTIDNSAYPNGVLEIDLYIGGGSSSGTNTAASVAADINANFASAGYSTIQLEYYSQVDSWVVGEIDFGAIGSVTQAQACATLATFLPSYVTQYAANSGPQDPASGANDYVGDGSAYYSYYGYTQDMVIVNIYAYDYGGNVYGDIWVYELSI